MKQAPRIFALVVFMLASNLANSLFAVEPVLEKTDLFVSGEEGYKLYRIPGIVVTKRGTVLAYCEARKSDSGDWGPIDVLLRRSTDGGKTWLPRQQLVRVEGDLPINPVAAAQKLDKPGDNTVNNPVAIVDHATGAVHLLYCLEYQIGYGAIVPKPAECENLFVTFALSASHTAFSSIRMEPVFMVTSQSAATAASLAIDANVPVQQVDQGNLRERLLADGQILAAGQKPVVRQSTATPQRKSHADGKKPLRILPLGDSITRGSYIKRYDDGPHKGKAIGLPHSEGGGYRKPLQDKLRAAGIAYDFVGELNYGAFGRDGVVDAEFDPDHHGLAGFSNARILSGGVVPTLGDVLEKLAVKEIEVPGIAKVLEKHRPDVILLLSGANGLDDAARDRLIREIGEQSSAHLLVATILPQQAPRPGWQKVAAYNASLPKTVAAQQAAGKRITLVDMHAAIATEDLLPDGVHPTKTGMEKMATVWFDAVLKTGLQTARPKAATLPAEDKSEGKQNPLESEKSKD